MNAPRHHLATPGPTTAERFRQLIVKEFGLRFEDDRLAWLGDLLAARAKACKAGSEERYLASLAQARAQEEWRQLASALTVGETSFFRHAEQFEALRERILPERLAMAHGRPLRILSAGCASGDEAYSIAMTVAALPQAAAHKVEIDAIDVNPQALDKARLGRWGSWSLRDTPEAMRARWFRQEGDVHVLDERIRAAVRFSRHNLADAHDAFWRPAIFDVVMCRNVLMYFEAAQLEKVLARLTRSMAPGAYLLLGHAESLRGLSAEFELCQSHGTFYHRRRRPADQAATPSPAQRAALPPAHRRTPRSRQAAPDQPWQGPAELPRNAMRLFTQERFQEALMALEAETGALADAPPLTQVLRALLLLHVHRAAEAEACCRRALTRHPFHADLQHALALSLAAQDAPDQAMDSDQRATYLDPHFAMPQLHLSMLARLGGDAAASRQASALAWRLMARESATRIQLFGGGFGREALMQLCQADAMPDGARP